MNGCSYNNHLVQSCIIDVMSKIEQNNLNFVILNWHTQKAEIYSKIEDVIAVDIGLNIMQVRHCIVLFVGIPSSPCLMLYVY